MRVELDNFFCFLWVSLFESSLIIGFIIMDHVSNVTADLAADKDSKEEKVVISFKSTKIMLLSGNQSV